MLTPIAKIGEISQEDDLSSLLDPISAKYVLAIQMERKNSKMSYIGISLEEVKDKRSYLYKRDLSGKPGLFLSWKIDLNDIRKLKKALDNNNDIKNTKVIEEIKDKKVAWLSRPPKIESNRSYESNLKILKSERIPSRLEEILSCYAENLESIWNDFVEKIKSLNKAERLLVTIKIQENGGWKYPGDHVEFVDLIRQYLLSTRSGG